jgi:hypothetical protein
LQSQLSGYLKPAKPDNYSESPCSCGLDVKRRENTAFPDRPDEGLQREPGKRNGEESVLRIDLGRLNRFESMLKLLGHRKRVRSFSNLIPGKPSDLLLTRSGGIAIFLKLFTYDD